MLANVPVTDKGEWFPFKTSILSILYEGHWLVTQISLRYFLSVVSQCKEEKLIRI